MAPQATPSVLLRNHQRDVETSARILRACACGDDPLELIAAYRRFESMILAHIDAEEALLLAAYAEHFPATARQIRDEHGELKRRLMQVAIDVELHGVRLEQIDELLQLIRTHAGFEDVTLYRWADGELSGQATATLATRISGSQPAIEPMLPAQLEHTGYSR